MGKNVTRFTMKSWERVTLIKVEEETEKWKLSSMHGFLEVNQLLKVNQLFERGFLGFWGIISKTAILKTTVSYFPSQKS